MNKVLLVHSYLLKAYTINAHLNKIYKLVLLGSWLIEEREEPTDLVLGYWIYAFSTNVVVTRHKDGVL